MSPWAIKNCELHTPLTIGLNKLKRGIDFFCDIGGAYIMNAFYALLDFISLKDNVDYISYQEQWD